jgi:hypothetical protein
VLTLQLLSSRMRASMSIMLAHTSSDPVTS